MKLEILDWAERDLVAGYRFYEAQRIGLGDYFLDSLYAEIDSLILFGGMHGVIAGYHRLLSRIFPYAVHYKVSRNTIQHGLSWIADEIRLGLEKVRPQEMIT